MRFASGCATAYLPLFRGFLCKRGKDEGSGRAGRRKADRPVYPQAFFFRFEGPRIARTPQKRWETAIRQSRENNPDRKLSSLPAERKRARHRGRHRRAARPGGSGGSNRTGSGRQAPAAQRVAHWMADRRRRAGKRESSRLFLRSLLPGASAGRGRRTSGVDGADIECATRRVKEINCKKGIF